MTKGGVTTDALDAEPLPPISPPQHSDPHSSNNGNGAHNINGTDMENAIKPADSPQDEEDDSKSTTSEQDNERVREKLKKTSIANVRSDSSLAGEHGEKDDALSNAVSEADQDMSDGKEDDTRRRRKRSFDETEGDGDGDGGGKDQRPRHRVHERKRSREISDEDMAKAAKALNRVKTPPTHPEEDEIMSQGEEEASTSITSPRKLERKRGRGRLDEDEKDKEVDPKKKISRKEEEWNRVVEKSMPSTNRGTTSVNVSTSGMANGGDLVTVEAATVKSSEGEQLPTNSGFANTSAKSPFATAGSGAKPLFGPGTSASDLFKNSKFGAASSSTTSPFASASPFASTSSFSPSPFGSINAQSSGSASPFGAGGLNCGSKAKPSGFGIGFSSGYGPSGFAALASKSGDVISSAPKLTKPLGGISAKPFGAPDEDDKNTSDEDDEGSDGDAEEKKEEPTTDEKAEIFTEQEVVTGEENEMTIFKTLGKIFFFDKENKQWKERGRGTLKLNRTVPFSGDDDEEAGAGEKFKDSARLIMRTEGTYLVVLNVPIYKGMKIGGDSSGSVPTSNQLYFMTLESGTPIQMIIKCKSTTIAKELHKHVSDLQEELFT